MTCLSRVESLLFSLSLSRVRGLTLSPYTRFAYIYLSIVTPAQKPTIGRAGELGLGDGSRYICIYKPFSFSLSILSRYTICLSISIYAVVTPAQQPAVCRAGELGPRHVYIYHIYTLSRYPRPPPALCLHIWRRQTHLQSSPPLAARASSASETAPDIETIYM